MSEIEYDLNLPATLQTDSTMSTGTLALIPARGGSKGLPGKNILRIAGKPLIAWTIEAALTSGVCERVLVTTDDPAIAKVAQTHGAEVPFLRPAELAQDDTSTIDAVLHAIHSLKKNEGYSPQWVLLLQPTSPLRSAADIRNAFDLAKHTGADAVVSVTPATEHPLWLKQIDASGRLTDFLPDSSSYTRRQDLPPVYSLNGAIYLVRRDTLVKERKFVPPGTAAYIMPNIRSVDIDTRLDLRIAELLLTEGDTYL